MTYEGDEGFEDYKLPIMPRFDYFVSCFFVQSYGLKDLPKLIKDYQESAGPILCEELIRECTLALSMANKDVIFKFLATLGRPLTEEKLEYMLKLIITELSFTSGDEMR